MKKKIKLKDLTRIQYLKWRMVYKNPNNCSGTCEKCPLRLVHCHPETKECWIYHTEIFTDKFLNKTIEIEIPDILTKEEKEYLATVIKPYKNHIKSIMKEIDNENKDNDNLLLVIFLKEPNVHTPMIPLFKNEKGEYAFAGMEMHLHYNLSELGLDN